jgi:hypothetical protein
MKNNSSKTVRGHKKGLLFSNILYAVVLVLATIIIGSLLLWFWVFQQLSPPSYSYKGDYIVKIYDNDSNLPIEGAKVRVVFTTGWGNHGIKEILTDEEGRVVFSIYDVLDTKKFGTSGEPTSLLVDKEGYHKEGMNDNRFDKDHNYIIMLNKIKDPQSLIKKSITFRQGDKADFLTAIASNDSKKLRNIPVDEITSNIDFDFPEIKNEFSEQKNVIGPGTARIRFFGAGGIQELPTDTFANSHLKDFVLENVFNAPTSGYKKELEIVSGGEYIARLSDGRHYMKLTASVLKTINVGDNYAEIEFYIQPQESTNLEHIETLLKSGF